LNVECMLASEVFEKGLMGYVRLRVWVGGRVVGVCVGVGQLEGLRVGLAKALKMVY
jgi:hypothetical protein